MSAAGDSRKQGTRVRLFAVRLLKMARVWSMILLDHAHGPIPM